MQSLKKGMAGIVKNMEDSAMQFPPNIPVTPHRGIDFLVGSESCQGVGYRNYRPDGTNDWLLIYTVRGGGRILTASGRGLPTRAGSIVLFPPGSPQRYDTDPEIGHWNLLWFHFHPRPHWSHWLADWAKSKEPLLVEAEDRRRMEDCLRSGVLALRGNHAHSEDWAALRLEEGLLRLLETVRGARGKRRDARITMAMEWMASRQMQRFRVDQAARHVGLSPSRFAHLFREETGESPAAWMEKLRLREARRQLAYSSAPVAEIAAQHGFDDPFHFSKRFRSLFGLSPSQFRKTSMPGSQTSG